MPAMAIWILRDYDRCSGCRLCEIECSLKHEGRIWPEASRIRIFELVPGINIPHLCAQCSDTPCVKACPKNALCVDEKTGAIKVKVEDCIECGLCIEACPAKIPRILPGKKGVLICDLCDGDPVCVKVCSEFGYNALKVVARDDVNYEYSVYRRHPEEVTKDMVKKIYRLKPEEVI